MPLKVNEHRWLIALLLPLAGIAAAAASLPERASYFAGGFAPAFAEVRGLLGLVRTCREKFTASCGRPLDETAPGLASIVEVVPFITVLGTGTGGSTGGAVTEASIGTQMVAARDRFNRELLSFDKDLLQRYRALLSVCPYQKDDFLPPNLDVTFPRYWRLTAQNYAKVKSDIQSAADRSALEIREWPKERCVAARNFGNAIVHSLTLRLRPYAAAGSERITPNQRLDKALSAAFAVAVAFEETVHPDVMKEIEARMIAFEKKNKSSTAVP